MRSVGSSGHGYVALSLLRMSKTIERFMKDSSYMLLNMKSFHGLAKKQLSAGYVSSRCNFVFLKKYLGLAGRDFRMGFSMDRFSRHRKAGHARVLTILMVSIGLSAASALPAGAVECEVRVTKEEHSLRLESVVRTTGPLAGDYTLLVDKRNAAGSSQNSNSGSFELLAGGEKILSTIVVDHEREGDVRALLSLKWVGGEKSCQYP